MKRQCSKLRDIKGKLIFEGDIVRRSYIFNNEEVGHGIVKFGVYNYSHCKEYPCTHYGWYIDFVEKGGEYYKDTGYPLYIDLPEIFKNEIIGNVRDNPELLSIK